MTSTPAQKRNCYKSVLSRPQFPPKLETDKNQLFQDHHTLLTVEIVINQFFHGTSTPCLKKKLLKISSFKTTTFPPKVEIDKNQLF